MLVLKSDHLWACFFKVQWQVESSAQFFFQTSVIIVGTGEIGHRLSDQLIHSLNNTPRFNESDSLRFCYLRYRQRLDTTSARKKEVSTLSKILIMDCSAPDFCLTSAREKFTFSPLHPALKFDA